jgi:hypothetical protein
VTKAKKVKRRRKEKATAKGKAKRKAKAKEPIFIPDVHDDEPEMEEQEDTNSDEEPPFASGEQQRRTSARNTRYKGSLKAVLKNDDDLPFFNGWDHALADVEDEASGFTDD